MTAHDALLIAVGMVAGFCLGFVTAWRQARKLEHHGVRLWEWDEPFDAHATPARSKIIGRVG